MNIEDLLKPTEPHINQYNHYINSGKAHLAKSSIAFACLIRDVESVLEKNVDKVINFCNTYAKNYNIVFFENDSTDNTKKKLSEIKTKYSNIEYISRDYGREKFGPVKSKIRTIALAEYRNELKDFIQKQYTTDYIIVFDFDFIDFSENGILNSFGWLSEYDSFGAIAGNSFEIRKVIPGTASNDLWNYDSWAYRHCWWEDLTQYQAYENRNYDPMLWFGLHIPPIGSTPFKVNSAFGGSCIYRSNYYYNGTYEGSDCEHVTFHHSLYNDNSFQLFLNPSQIMVL